MFLSSQKELWHQFSRAVGPLGPFSCLHVLPLCRPRAEPNMGSLPHSPDPVMAQGPSSKELCGTSPFFFLKTVIFVVLFVVGREGCVLTREGQRTTLWSQFPFPFSVESWILVQILQLAQRYFVSPFI